MNLVLFDDKQVRDNLLPLTFTRPVADIRIGILTLREKWQRVLDVPSSSSLTEAYLCAKYPVLVEEDNLLVNSCLFPGEALLDQLNALETGSSLKAGDRVLAAKVSAAQLEKGDLESALASLQEKTISIDVDGVFAPSDIFSKNGTALEADYQLLTEGRSSQPIDPSNTVLGDRLFIEEGAKVRAAILNTESGPIYIGKNAEVMEGAVIRGPFSLGESGQVKLAAKVYGPTTVGPHAKIGGEVNNSVIFGYSNKGHDGFLGNSVIGEWCNLGADTNTSNLKNNYANVRLWNYQRKRFADTGMQFCGLVMGDHSKCGINTMFNTGTVVGVSANIFGAGFPRNFVPSYSWGGASGFTTYKLEKTFEVAELVMARRKKELTEADREILKVVFEQTAEFRS